MGPAGDRGVVHPERRAVSVRALGRPLVPVVFGVEDASLAVFKGAFEAVVALAGHRMAETDPELGANLMVFCFREWGELLEVKDLPAGAGAGDAGGEAGGGGGEPVPDLPLSMRRARSGGLRLPEDGCGACGDGSGDAGAGRRRCRRWCSGRIGRLTDFSPCAGWGPGDPAPGDRAVIRAGYDPVMPVMARDASMRQRLAARTAQADAG